MKIQYMNHAMTEEMLNNDQNWALVGWANHLKRSGVRRLHFEVFSAIQV